MNTHFFIGLMLLVISLDIYAHEYWLDPIDASVSRGESAIIDVRNGQDFIGSAFPFDASNFQSILVSSEDRSQVYSGRLGDYPAIHPEFDTNGLHSINLSTSAKLLTYQSWQKFNAFLEYHGLSDIAKRHLERDLPTETIQERYYRSAKTMIQVSDDGTLRLEKPNSLDVDSHHAFKASNFVFELILLDNPYSTINSIRIKLLFNEEPLAGRQAEMFFKNSNLQRFTAKTDEDGIATFKILGAGEYLFNAVQVMEPDTNDVDWVSYWASMTFER